LVDSNKNVIVAGPCYGELFWEFFRFAPYVFKVAKDHPNLKLIVCTRPERYDIYGDWADEFIPFNVPQIKGKNLLPDCFRLIDFPTKDRIELEMRLLHRIVENNYQIQYYFKPQLSNNQFCNKDQFPMSHRLFEYKVRSKNLEVVNKALDKDKPIIVLAPRMRKGFARNWPHWNDFYDMIFYDKELEKYQFVICGKTDEMYYDPLKRFIDINDFHYPNETSLIGVTIEILKRAIFTVGSQSAIPNISLIMGTPVLQWGNQKNLHTKTYNIYKTKVEFIEDPQFTIDPKIIFNHMKKNLKLLGD